MIRKPACSRLYGTSSKRLKYKEAVVLLFDMSRFPMNAIRRAPSPFDRCIIDPD
jgi:hypothetical protein